MGLLEMAASRAYNPAAKQESLLAISQKKSLGSRDRAGSTFFY